jgi:hypothetical protein
VDMIPWLVALAVVAVIAWTVGAFWGLATGVIDGARAEGERWAASAVSGGPVRHGGREYVVMTLPEFARLTRERRGGWVHLRSDN